MLLGTIVLLAVMMVIVTIHEVGHLIVAKKYGVGVPTFSIGFGPRIIGFKFYKGKMSYKLFNNYPSNVYVWRKGETEYRLSPIPFGGYCAMEGEMQDEGNPRALANKPFIQKFAVAMGGCIANFITGYAVLVAVVAPKLGFFASFKYSFLTIKAMVVDTYIQTVHLITGTVPLAKWGEIAEASASMASFEGLLLQFAFFSVVLGIFNLIPFPALDGSLPFLWALDYVFGKDKGQRIANNLVKVGFFLLMGLQLAMVFYWIFM
jgi:membrane-associated protease RseP (regulator of RpoE activity)